MMRKFVLSAAFILSAGLAYGQTAPAPDELLALNFYVQQNDTASTNAELRRLQLKYPGWQPPQDLTRLSVTAPSSEIDAIYRDIAAGRFDAARATIATTRATYPDWTPPDDMMTLLATSQGQGDFDRAITAGNLAEANRIASATPGLLRCDRISNPWRIAEVQQAKGQNREALATYRAIAAACVNPAEVSATLEKANAVASTAEMTELFALVTSRLPDQKPALDTLRERLMAGRGAATTAAPATKPAAKPVPAPSPGPVARNASPAPARPAPSGGRGGDAGFQAAVNSGDWAGCMARSAGSRSASVIYQRGWCAFNLDQPMEAVTAFQTALKGRLDATQQRDARYGIALAYLKMQMSEEASRIAAATDFTRTQRVDIERQILDQRGVAAYKRKQYRQAIEYFDALEGLTGGIRRDLAVLRAYARLNNGDRPGARQEFQRLHNELATNETRRGLNASQ